MATPYAATYVTLGGLILRTRAIDCPDWSGLLKSPRKRGANRRVRGVAGRSVRPRANDELRAILPIVVDASWDDENTYLGGSEQERHARLYSLLAEVRGVADDTDVQTLLFTWADGSTSVDCIVEEMTEPVVSPPWRASFALDVTLPDGPLDLTADP